MKTKTGKSKKHRKYRVPVALLVVAVLLCAGLFGGYQVARKVLYPIRYSGLVSDWAGAYGVDPLLVQTIILTESGFDPRAESSVGARGLMQMTEDTFEWIKSKIAPGEPLAFADLYQPEVAVRFGTYFFAISMQRYGGDVPTAAAAYHSGWGTVDRLLQEGGNSTDGKTLQRFPYAQMQHYVNKINKNYKIYQLLYS